MRLCIALLAVMSMYGQSIVDPPEFTGKPTKPRKEPSETQLAFFTTIGSVDNSHITEAMQKVSTFIESHPAYADGYAFRVLGQYCQQKQPATEALLSDVNKAIQFFEPDGLVGNRAELYGMKARLEYDLGRFAVAMDDLEKGIRLSPDSAGDVVSVGGVKPGTRAEEENLCAWTRTELDGFAKRFPRDYRVPLYRGIYFSKLGSFDEGFRKTAIQEFQQALILNPKSALAHYFIGAIHSHDAFMSKAAIQSDEVKDTLRRSAASEYTLAIGLDKQFKEAFANRADSYLGLKQYQAAIRDYDRVIELDPKDASVFHDRALAKDELGNVYAAIYDFDEAIRLDGLSDIGLPNAYENRGDAHFKIGQYKEAIADYSQLIKLRLDSMSFLMPLKEFRNLYPEYASLSDRALVKKVHDMFFPKYDEDSFLKQITENKGLGDFLLPGAYEKRMDAYLRNLQFRKAFADYNRAVVSSDNDGKFIERWRSIGKGKDTEQLIDIKTLEFAPSSKLWMKTTKAKGYDLDAFELDCRGNRLRQQSSLTYDDGGKMTASSALGAWQPIIPDTLGEQLYTGVCKAD